MIVIQKERVVPYTDQQMYQLVADIRQYSVFLPWCVGSEVLLEDAEQVEASLTLGRGGIEKRITTRNCLYPHHKITMELLSGPLKSLTGEWQFVMLDEVHCRVSLHLQIEFSNFISRQLLQPLFKQISNELVDAFCERANEVYSR